MSAKERLAAKIKNNKNNSNNNNFKSDDVTEALAYLSLVLEQYHQQNNLPNISEHDNIKSNNNNLNNVGEQVALLITGAISFIVAFAWNELLKNLQGDTFKQEPFYNLIYVIGITIFAAIIIYYITILVEHHNQK